MKAVMVRELGSLDNLELQELEDPKPAAGQVVVDVKACGVTFPDVLMVLGRYQHRPPVPFAPGGEMAGVVREVGDGVADLRPGDRVMAFTGFGAFCDRMLLGADRLVHIPDEMDFATAGGFGFNYATSYHALQDRARLRSGETLLVLGAAGGVGLTAVELGKKMGARVIAAASTAEKLELCARYGADEGINYRTEDLKQRAKALSSGGVDVVYDPVGGDYSEPALRSLRPFGRHLVIGFASGTIPKLPLNLPLLKECEVLGVAWGSWAMRNPGAHYDNVRQLLRWYAEGELAPYIWKRLPLEQAAEALRAVADRQVRGKIVLVNE